MTAHLLLSTRVCFGRRLKEKISGSEYNGGFTFSETGLNDPGDGDGGGGTELIDRRGHGKNS